MSGPRVVLRIALLAALAQMLCACSYRFVGEAPDGVDGLSIPVAENLTRYRGAEQTLTAELVREIQARTGWRIADDDTAEARLETSIVQIPRLPIIVGARDRVFESSAVVVVEVRLVDRLSGRDRVRPFRVARRVEQAVSLNDPLELVVDEALRDVARQIPIRLATRLAPAPGDPPFQSWRPDEIRAREAPRPR